MMQEEWRPVRGFENAYEVSNLGRVRSKTVTRSVKAKDRLKPYFRTYKGRVIKPHICHQDGYARAVFYGDNHKATVFIHRVVAEAFLPNPEGKPEVNHKNKDKADCSVENLEWATARENLLHAFADGLRNLVKYVVFCRDFNVTTIGSEVMRKFLVSRGYANASSPVIIQAGRNHGKHLGLSFRSVGLSDFDGTTRQVADLLNIEIDQCSQLPLDKVEDLQAQLGFCDTMKLILSSRVLLTPRHIEQRSSE